MGLLSNRISRESLKPGDHIYSWRTAYIYAHHGIYIGDDKVIHFTRLGQEVGTGTVLGNLLVSSCPAKSVKTCPTCTPNKEGHGVILSCLTCFLAGRDLYRYEYAVSRVFFLAKVRGGACTLAVSDPDDVVVHRAKYLLDKGFGFYDVSKNNCEDFTLYCKTGLDADRRIMGLSGQAASFKSGFSAVISMSSLFYCTNGFGMAIWAARAATDYCNSRCEADIGMRRDIMKVSVEDLTR